MGFPRYQSLDWEKQLKESEQPQEKRAIYAPVKNDTKKQPFIKAFRN
jgi:hypothetical protein